VIAKQDILDRAAEWGLRPDVVEKDYVLGWMLAAIGRNPETSAHWVFKGGTCLKKCYVETHRFSEDLDFTLRPAAVYSVEGLRTILRDIAAAVEELTGIRCPADQVLVRSRKDKQDRPTFEGRIAYQGPLAVPSWPRVRFDLTMHETIVEAVEPRPVFHPYPDELPTGTSVGAYPLTEITAEKTRALLERTLPRDLYDVVFLLENSFAALDIRRLRSVFTAKCAAKGLVVPSAREMVAEINASVELRSEWENMLDHQLPELVPLDNLLPRVPALLAWIDTDAPLPAAALPRVPMHPAEAALPSTQYWGIGVPLEVIRFAGSNRLMVEFTYHGRHRLVEPYLLKRAQTGNLLLYGWESGAGHIKAFKVAEISGLSSTRSPFQPRYRIEV
jgi:predicted nucleotidyltransferase component of viral defense system